MGYKLYYIYSQVQVHETYIYAYTSTKEHKIVYNNNCIFKNAIDVVHTQYKHLLLYNVSAKSKQIL